MNKYITRMGVSLALMATTLSSCDLDTTPTTSLDSDAAFKTTTYAENVLRGAWSYAFNEGQTYQSIGIFSVLLSDDFMGSDCVAMNSSMSRSSSGDNYGQPTIW
jgi:starch-binding outer membrane protein, SusD/RagB family